MEKTAHPCRNRSCRDSAVKTLRQGIFVATITEELRIEAQPRYCMARGKLVQGLKPEAGRSLSEAQQVACQTFPGAVLQWSKVSTIRVFASNHLDT
jgi:hypothetical protein